MYLSVSLFHVQTAVSISTKFCTDLHTNSGKVFNNPLIPGYSKLQNLNKSLEKKLCFTKNVWIFSGQRQGQLG